MNTTPASAAPAPDQETPPIKETVVSWDTALQLQGLGFVCPSVNAYIRPRRPDGLPELVRAFPAFLHNEQWDHVPAYQLHELLSGLVAYRQTGEYINVKLNLAAVNMIRLTNEPICSVNYGPMGVDGLTNNWAEALAQLIVQAHQRRRALDPVAPAAPISE